MHYRGPQPDLPLHCIGQRPSVLNTYLGDTEPHSNLDLCGTVARLVPVETLALPAHTVGNKGSARR